MKKVILIAGLLAVLLVGGLWVGQGIVNRRLAAALPEASAKSGVSMTAGALGVNVWNGSGAIRDLSIANPPGFPEQPLFTLTEGYASIRYLPLLRGRVQVGELTVREATLTLIRNAEGRLNVKRRAVKDVPAPPAGDRPPPEAPPAETAAKALPEMGIDQLLALLTLNYVDYSAAVDGKPYEARFHLELTGSGLATYGDEANEDAWGLLKAEGYVESGSLRSPVQLSGRIAPLVKPASPSFRVTGSIEKLDPEMIRPLLGKNSGIKGEAERIDLALVADKGRFDERESKIILTLKNVKLGDRVLETAVLTIPLHGTVDKPKLRLEQALFDLLSQALTAPDKGSSSDSKKKGLNLEGISKGLESLFKSKK